MKKLFVTVSAAALLAPLSAFADVTLNSNFSTSGYIAGSYRYTSPDPGTDTDRFDMDAAKALFSGSFEPVTGVLSFYYAPGAPSEVTVLDAYATVNLGGGTSITAGKFLSYMGYEAFDIPNLTQITYANGDFLAPIPGYHTGVKIDYSSDTVAVGAALLDSVYSGPFYLKGDGELKSNAGFEAYLAFKSSKATLWTGIVYDTEGSFQPDNVWITDTWVSYALSDTLSLGAEYVYKDAGIAGKGFNWLVFLGVASSPKFSWALRVSGEDIDNGPSFTRYTISPTYKVNDNFLVRAEYTYTSYSSASLDSASFFGLQTVFKF